MEDLAPQPGLLSRLLGRNPPLLSPIRRLLLRGLRRTPRRHKRASPPGHGSRLVRRGGVSGPRDRQTDHGPARQRSQPTRPQALRSLRLPEEIPPALAPHRLLPRHPELAVSAERALIPPTALRSIRHRRF